MGGCQNYGPILGPLNARCRIILRNQRETIILTTTRRNMITLGSKYGLRRNDAAQIQPWKWERAPFQEDLCILTRYTDMSTYR